MSSKHEQMKQAIERIGPYLFNEDADPSDTIELHAKFDVDENGMVYFGEYYVGPSDGSIEEFSINEMYDDCACALCGVLWFLEKHVHIVESQPEPAWYWAKIAPCVKEYFASAVEANGGQVDDSDNVFDLIMKYADLEAVNRETVSIKDFSDYDIKKVNSLIVYHKKERQREWLGEFHPYMNEPVYWHKNKALLVDEIIMAYKSENPSPLMVVGTRGE